MSRIKGRLKRVHQFIGYRDGMGSLLSSAGVSASTGVGAAPEAEAGSLSAVGLHMDAGDEHDFFWTIPNNLNHLHPIGIKVRFSSATATGGDNHTFIGLFDILTVGTSAIAIGSTVLDTTIAVTSAIGTADVIQETARGVINGATVSEANVAAMDVMAINIELDADDASEEMNVYGIIVDFVPKMDEGSPLSYNADSYTY